MKKHVEQIYKFRVRTFCLIPYLISTISALINNIIEGPAFLSTALAVSEVADTATANTRLTRKSSCSHNACYLCQFRHGLTTSCQGEWYYSIFENNRLGLDPEFRLLLPL